MDWQPVLMLWPGVVCTWTNDAIVFSLLEHVCSPTCKSAHHEDRSKQFGWNVHEVIGRGVEKVRITEQHRWRRCDLYAPRVSPGHAGTKV